MRYVLTEREIAIIESIINQRGSVEACVKIEKGKIVVVEITRKLKEAPVR